MALTVRQLRDRIAEGLTSSLAALGWTESRYPAELIGMDSRDQRHLAFAVGVPVTTPHELDRQSSRGGQTPRGAVSATRVVVRWGHHLQTDGEAASYSEMLDAEAVLVASILALDANPQMALRLLSLERRADGDLVDGTITLECLHRLPLA